MVSAPTLEDLVALEARGVITSAQDWWLFLKEPPRVRRPVLTPVTGDGW